MRKKIFVVSFLLMAAFSVNCQSFTYDLSSRLVSITYPDGKTITYAYDKLGNRTTQTIATNDCPATTKGYNAGNAGIAYQWQVNAGNGFANIAEGPLYFGTQTDSLIITNPPTAYRGYQYRCAVNTGNGTVYSAAFVFKPKATWQGGADSLWQNPANWECSLVPDEYVDVVVPSGKPHQPVVVADAKVYSLKAETGAAIVIKAGVSLAVKGKE